MGNNNHALRDWAKKIEKLASEEEKRLFFESGAKELAARFLGTVIPDTPVGHGEFEIIRGKDGRIKKFTRGKNKGKLKFQRIRDGGVLRRGWTAKSESEAASGSAPDAAQYSKTLPVVKDGGNYHVDVINPVHYASYVEYGHRQKPGRFVPAIEKRLKKGWIAGQFMMTNAMIDTNEKAPGILSKKLDEWLKRGLK